jgi:rod shape-determining protein MreC
MRRLPLRTSTALLFLVSLGLYLLPPDLLGAWRLALYSAWSRADRAGSALAQGPAPSLERGGRAAEDPASQLADARRQLRELRGLLDRRSAELADARRRLAQLSEAQELVPQLETLRFQQAEVLLRHGAWPRPTGAAVILDRGRRDGLRAGDVLLQGHAVLGQIVELGEHAARAVLLDHPNLIVAARLGKARTECYVQGRLETGPEVVFLGRRPEAEAGDLVVTSGLLGRFPPDLIVGELAAPPAEDRDERTYTAPLRPRAELEAVEAVLVVQRRLTTPWPPAADADEEG